MSFAELASQHGLLVGEGDVDYGRLLFPRLAVYLHREAFGKLDAHVFGLPDAEDLAEADLELGDVKRRVDAEHFHQAIAYARRFVCGRLAVDATTAVVAASVKVATVVVVSARTSQTA